MSAQAAYRLHSPTSRAAAVSLIVCLHVAGAIAAVTLGGGIRIAMQRAEPLLVRLLPASSKKPVEPVQSVRPLALRAQGVRLPAPPSIENRDTVRSEESEPPAAPAPVSMIAAAAPSSPAPALEPPRADAAYLDNPAPAYPPTSKRSGEQGRVVLRVRVDASGTVEAVEVQATSGFARLDEAALAAVRRWRFLPARLGERAVAGWALVPINFSLRS